MTVTVMAKFSSTIPADGTYRVKVEILSAAGIEMDVLVFDTNTDAFQNVATVYDLETWPVVKNTALNNYRGRTATVDFDSIRGATDFITVTKNRLHLLATGWNSIEENFPNTETVTYVA